MRGNIRTSVAVAVTVTAAVWMGCAHGSTSSTIEPERECEEGATSENWGASSVYVVCAEDFEGVPAFQLEQWLEGRVPGLWVVHGPRGPSLLIRGRSSFLGNTEPLYVLDGVPLQLEPGRGLYWLSPRDIQRVEILKDASATAIYGVRGANGVVLITTRR